MSYHPSGRSFAADASPWELPTLVSEDSLMSAPVSALSGTLVVVTELSASFAPVTERSWRSLDLTWPLTMSGRATAPAGGTTGPVQPRAWICGVPVPSRVPEGDDDAVDERLETTEALGERPELAPEPEVRITPQQLRDYLAKAAFGQTLGRKGYHQGEVDAFLVRLSEAVAEGEPLADLVRRHRFTHVRLEGGYETRQVDDFLDAVVDLDPHASAAPPEPQRKARLTKLFG